MKELCSSHRVHDLSQMLELAEQSELNEKELEIVCQRVYATKGLLEEHEMDLRKRTIDLLFEFYIPPEIKSLGGEPLITNPVEELVQIRSIVS